MMASCSSDEEFSNAGEKFKGNVTITAEPYTFADGDTRTTLANTGNKISFAWDNDEAIGIFPIAPTTNIQAKQVLKNGSSNGTTSSFDGAGWALMYGNTYAAYYPYQQKEYEDYTKIPIDMTGQTQNGNNSLAHIGEGYDYMYANAKIPTNGNVNFDFKHVTSIVMLELTMPDAATWQSVTLTNKAGNNVFTTSATLNVSTGAVTSKATSSEVTLLLDNVSTTASSKILTIYLAVLPTTTGDLAITAKTSANKSYTANLTGKTLVAGKAYRFVTSLAENTVLSHNGYENGYEWVDLGLSVKWATMNVGATSVKESGDYYSWGEIEPRENNSKSSYKWYSVKITTNPNGNLKPEDDVVAQIWGGAWRMPTKEEMEELVNNCFWMQYSARYCGYYVFAAKNESDKGKFTDTYSTSLYTLSDAHIFLPAGGYWTSTIYLSHYSDGAWALDPPIADNINYFISPHNAWAVFPVRAVCE